MIDAGSVETRRTTATETGVDADVEAGRDGERKAELDDEDDDAVDATPDLDLSGPPFHAERLVNVDFGNVDLLERRVEDHLE